MPDQSDSGTSAAGTTAKVNGNPATGNPATVKVPDSSSWGTDMPIQQIYTQIQNLFGSSNTSLFQMEFPCRLLDRGTYDYKGSDTINAQQIKPPPVIEAEFQLSDDLYDLANIVGGPNGSKLSSQYEEILFSLIPTSGANQSSSDIALKNDQVYYYEPWVAEKPPQKYLESRSPGFQARTNVAANPNIPRVDLYQKLLDTYESEKARWVQYKIDARPRDNAKQSELDAYDRLLQTYAPVVDAKLEALWTLLVVRGQYHRVQTYLSYIDVESASGLLQQAKENLRACVSRNIDDSEDIYPVLLSPSNWATYLSTDFQPTDLLSNPTTMLQALFNDEKALAMLQAKQRELLGNNQDVTKTTAALQTAQAQYQDANVALGNGLPDSVVSLVKVYFNAALAGLTAEEDPVAAVKNRIIAWSQLCTHQQALMAKQSQLTIVQSNYARAQTSAAEAAALDNKTQLYTINNQIMSKQMDIRYYQSMLKQVQNPTDQPITIPGQPDATGKPTTQSINPTPIPLPPTSLEVPNVLGGASVWQTITVQFKAGSSDTSEMVTVNVDDKTVISGCLFWSHSTTTSTTTENSTDLSNTSNTNVQVGFNVMKVEIQRPWMNAGFFNQTQQFYRTVDTPIASYDPEVVATALQNLNNFTPGESGPGLLPSFPTSFIVAKDIHIIYTTSSSFSDSTKEAVESSTSSGGGFLCFQSSSSSEGPGVHHENTSIRSADNAISIKIPAPQILGWISELVAKDDAQT